MLSNDLFTWWSNWTTCIHVFVPRPLFLQQCCEFPTPSTSSHHCQPSPPSMASNSTTTIPPWFQQKSRHEENLPPPGNDFRNHYDCDNDIEDIWGFHVPHAYVWAFIRKCWVRGNRALRALGGLKAPRGLRAQGDKP